MCVLSGPEQTACISVGVCGLRGIHPVLSLSVLPCGLAVLLCLQQTNLDDPQVALPTGREQTTSLHLLIPFLSPPPSAHYMPSSLIDLPLFSALPCFIMPPYSFCVVLFLYLHGRVARPRSPNPRIILLPFVSIGWSLPCIHTLLGCLCSASIKLFSKHRTIPRQNVMHFK